MKADVTRWEDRENVSCNGVPITYIVSMIGYVFVKANRRRRYLSFYFWSRRDINVLVTWLVELVPY